MTERSASNRLAIALAIVTADASVAQSQQVSQPLPVQVTTAERQESFQRDRVYTGTLVARRRSALSFERAGKLLSVAVEEGQAVAAGETLARLDTRRLTAQRAQADAELTRARAVLDELLAGPREQTIEATRAEVESLAAIAELAQRRTVRREQLVPTDAISREEYEEAFYNYRNAAARTERARQTLDELEEGTRQEQIEAQRAAVLALEARLKDIDHEIEDTRLLSPFAGRVVRRRLDEGTVISPGEVVLDLIEDTHLEAWIGVPPHTSQRLSVGQSLPVEVQGAEHPAVVQSIRPELDPETRTQNVVLRIEHPGQLVAGQVALVGVPERVVTPGFWVPTAALRPARRGLWSLLVVGPDDHAAARPVEVIETAGDRSYVSGTLAGGERVIAEGAHRVVAGQAVRPLEE